jgi:hypothetical protein
VNPPKAKRAPAKSALRKLRVRVGYYTNAVPASIFGKPFWFFEQRRGRFADLLDNEERDDR